MSQATADRRQRILTELLDSKRVTVRELAEVMAVSEATVRRDLRELAHREEVTLVHGGATLPKNGDYSIQAKRLRHVEEKTRIGAVAAGLVQDGEQVFLDPGTTSFAMLDHLRRRRGVTIITNSIRLAGALDGGGGTGPAALLLGGQVRPDRMDAVGPLALTVLEQLRGYSAFLGADGLTMEFGPSAADIESAHLHRLVVQHAREATLLVDHSKFETCSLFRIVEWERITRIVTDRPPTDAWRTFLDQHGVAVVVAEEE